MLLLCREDEVLLYRFSLQVKQPRNFSASATRSRNRQKESSSSVWESAGVGTLQCTGVRAELVSRNGESCFSNEPLDAVDTEEYRAFPGEAENRRRDASHQLARKAELGRFQWVTNDDGVANFLQRPPSRQKEAFPTHLADVVPYAAFKVFLERVNGHTKDTIVLCCVCCQAQSNTKSMAVPT